MSSFSWHELDKAFEFDFSLIGETFLLCIRITRMHPNILSSYVNTYISEEIKQGGHCTECSSFFAFSWNCRSTQRARCHSENIARDAAVARSNVDVYFSILLDTLLGNFLPGIQAECKGSGANKLIPSFYWSDSSCRPRRCGSLFWHYWHHLWKGTSLETMVLHELQVYNHVKNLNRGFYYYKTAAGSEIDFIIETKKRRTLRRHMLYA